MAKKAKGTSKSSSWDDDDEDEGWVEDKGAVEASGAKASEAVRAPAEPDRGAWGARGAQGAVEGASYDPTQHDPYRTSAGINTSAAYPEAPGQWPQVHVTHEKKEAVEFDGEKAERFMRNRGLWHEYQTWCVQQEEMAKQDAAREAAKGEAA